MTETVPRRRCRVLLPVALLLLSVAALILSRPSPVSAAITGAKTCIGPGNVASAKVGDSVTCTIVIRGDVGSSDLPSPTLVSIFETAANFDIVAFGAVSCVATSACVATLIGSTVQAACAAACQISSITILETLVILSASPDTITQQASVLPGGSSFPTALTLPDVTPVRIVASVASNTYFVAPTAPPGNDTNTCTSTNDPCATIQGALTKARDRDTILLLAGTHIAATTIRVNKLVTIAPDSGAKVIVKTRPGNAVFEVTAQGGPGLHVVIRDLTLGGFSPTEPADAAFRLVNDSFTEIVNNIIGAEDLPLNNGIVLANSDHANIRDNTIQGNSRFRFVPVFTVGKTQTGFGIVTIECLGGGGIDVSDSVSITNNVFTNLWLAGVWMCSDGGGEHLIRANTFRGNHRGLVLKDITNSTIQDNVLVDDRSDGIILYGASLRNRLVNNRVESHVSVDAAGIRIGWVADPLAPLDNRLENNRLARDTIGVHIFGARSTRLINNEIKISGSRTAILITPSSAPGDPGTQPYDTEITGNVLIFQGACGRVLGCAIRLLGTSVNVIATDNEWGYRRSTDVEGVIYHRADDPTLGQVIFQPFRAQIDTPTPTPSATATATATSPPGTIGNSNSFAPPTPAPTTTTSGTGTGGTAPPGTIVLDLDGGCQTIRWPGPNGVSVVDAVMGLQPAIVQRAVIVLRQEGGEWVGWGPETSTPEDIFFIDANQVLQICVSQPATWIIPTAIGDP